jgi:hypothetical protein
LRKDFVLFAGRCLHDLNPQAALALNRHLEVIAAKADGGAPGQRQTTDYQPAAAPSEVPDGLDRLPGLVPRA